jgi:tetrahydromethanopterin S-methyltransferase subunit F
MSGLLGIISTLETLQYVGIFFKPGISKVARYDNSMQEKVRLFYRNKLLN